MMNSTTSALFTAALAALESIGLGGEHQPPGPRQVVLVVVAAVTTVLCFLLTTSTKAVDSEKQRWQRLSGGEVVAPPPHIQSWIPFVGSAITMGQEGIANFIRNKSLATQSPVFTATIMGDKCVFLNDPELLYLVFKPKYQKYLDGLQLQKMFVHRVLNVTPSEMERVFGPRINKLGKQQYHHYLFHKDELTRSMTQVQDFFHRNLLLNCETTTQPLYSMVYSTVFKATMGPFVSQALVNDHAYTQFQTFDKGVAMLFNQAPSFVTAQARTARTYLNQFLQTAEFWRDASPLMKNRKETMVSGKEDTNNDSEESGGLLSFEALTKVNLGVMFAAIANSAPAIYWTLLQLMQNQEAWNVCRDQVDAIMEKKKKKTKKNDDDNTAGDDNNEKQQQEQPVVHLLSLEDLDELTYIDSSFWETLRLYQANFTARRVTQDFVLETTGSEQKFLIEKGSQLMPFWEILHTDPYVFSNPNQFQYDRFVAEDAKKRRDFYFQNGTKINYFPVVAFGGGEHLCPGRKFINYEAKLYLALLMYNYDMSLAKGESIPDVDRTTQGIGVSHPEREVQVVIRPRRRT